MTFLKFDSLIPKLLEYITLANRSNNLPYKTRIHHPCFISSIIMAYNKL